MDRYGVKASGTKEELEAISKAFGHDLDTNGVCNVDEDYRFSFLTKLKKLQWIWQEPLKEQDFCLEVLQTVK